MLRNSHHRGDLAAGLSERRRPACRVRPTDMRSLPGRALRRGRVFPLLSPLDVAQG